MMMEASKNSNTKRGDKQMATMLQPKLINPPSKLTRTLDGKGVKAGFVKRKPQAAGTRELNNF